MNDDRKQADVSDEKSPHLMGAVLAVILVALCASLWTVVRTFKKPLPADDAAPVVAEMQTDGTDAPATMPVLAASAPAPLPTPAVGGEFVTDFATMAQREQVARETADALRRQARENPESAVSEDFIKSVERGDAAIQ